MIGIIDFGSQYTWLIARRIRELGVKTEIIPYTQVNSSNLSRYNGLILSGSPSSLDKKSSYKNYKKIFETNIPVLGICYGMQLIAKLFKGKLSSGKKREYGDTLLKLKKKSILFADIKQKIFSVWMSHFDHVEKAPDGFEITSITENNTISSIESKKYKIYAVQFHPEVSHTQYGKTILKNFVFKICKSPKDWNLSKFIKNKIEEIKREAGDGKVIIALSGGVDSTVATFLVREAIGNRLYPIFVDTGLIRYGDIERIKDILIGKFNLNVRIVDAKKKFLKKLKGVIDPEKKRKIIGHEFIKTFEEYASKIKGITHLVQGTLYPDVIESAGAGTGSAVIKSHHNVGGLPEKMNLKLIEPLKELFKDEVRKVGKKLGLPDEIIYQHPFPGPGLAIRIIGEVTEDRLKILKKADKIVEEELKKAGIYYKIWQGFPVLIPIKTVGVMGDKRTYEHVIGLRIVDSVDGMTSRWVKVPYKILGKISSRIVNEVNGVNRVVYDLTNKPPATIEWE